MDQDSQSIDSLFDFLYIDKPRVNSWLAQLHADGVLTEFKKTANVSDQVSAEISGGVPGVLKAGERTSGSTTEGNERRFSPEWSAPLNLLDLLDAHGYINRGTSGAQIGSLVIVTGTIQLLDFEFLQKIWDPAIKLLAAQMKVTNGNHKAIVQQKAEMAIFGDVLKALPSTPQIYLRDSAGALVWSALVGEHMTINTSILALSHGSNIDGTWNMLASVDAMPSNQSDKENEDFVVNPLIGAGYQILKVIREVAGRSNQAFSATPILIFRQANKAVAGQ